MLLTACLFIGLLGAADSGPEATAPDMLAVQPSAVINTEIAQRNLFELINGERQKAGLKQLQFDTALSRAALDHAQLMSKQGKLSHQLDGEPELIERLATHAVRVDAASENVVYDVSAQGAHDAFLRSPRHAQNMLNAAYDAVGIAVVNDHGILYVVEDFAHRISSANDDEIALEIAAQVAKVREQAGLPSLTVISDSQVQTFVQQMAAHEISDSHGPLALPGVRMAASYATTTPDKIPTAVANIASFRGASACAIGVRFARTPHYPSGLFWITLVMIDQNALVAAK